MDDREFLRAEIAQLFRALRQETNQEKAQILAEELYCRIGFYQVLYKVNFSEQMEN